MQKKLHVPSRIVLLLISVAIVLTTTARAADPGLSAITPQGGQRGTEIEVKFTGQRLGDAKEILFGEPGITVVALEPEGDGAVKTKLAIAPDARLGIYGAWVRTASGVTGVRTFHVGALPDVAEVEPNSEFETPQKIDLDRTVTGVVQSEDVDYYLVEAKKGERITAEIEGLRLGRTFFDPYLAILDSKRFELAKSDDAALLYQDAVCSVVAPEDGSYIIEVRESAYQGSGACTYRLHVGRFPRPTAVYPAGGRPGEALEVRWIGDALGERVEKVTLPTEPMDEFALFAQDERGVAPSGNPFRVNGLPNALETEPNNELAQASSGEAPGAFNGILATEGDVDYFKFAAKKGQGFHVRVHARSLRSPLDAVVQVLRANGGQIAANDDSGGPDSYIRFGVPEDGEYLICVRDHLGAGGPNYVYRVEITPIEPQLTMSLPERQQYVATTVAVPRANRTALLIAASRVDFGGELNVAVEGMPAGMTMETVTMAANRNDIPVVFSVAPDAQPAGTLADVVGRPVDANIKAEGHLRQMNMLVRGQNNREVWSYYGDRMTLVSTEEVPFKIDLVQPQVPIVRGGSMGLKVVATRAEGYTAPIAVRMLYNPPGISSSGSISIAEGQTEAIIPLSANGNAELGDWKIVVTGQANVGGGNVLVSSGFANLQIAEPYFNFAFQKAAVEQGQPTELLIDVENKTPFEGAAQVELLGLPGGASTTPLELTKDVKQLVFKIQTEKDARVGRHTSILCRAVVTANGEPITHTLGTGELRIDQPLPPKVDAPKPEAKPEPKQVAAAEPPKEKPLSRLEKLRLERKQALEAEAK